MIAEAKIRRLMILLQATNFSLHACIELPEKDRFEFILLSMWVEPGCKYILIAFRSPWMIFFKLDDVILGWPKFNNVGLSNF